ncbi:MAG: hypothetical protein IPH84_19700 [Bacteroidales bacterium]|nr:hypothetical protein [Bacteroidales bacterium]
MDLRRYPHNRPPITAINPSPLHTFTQPGTFHIKLRVRTTIVGGSVISDSTQRSDHGNRHPDG